jgi:hypothetical protein
MRFEVKGKRNLGLFIEDNPQTHGKRLLVIGIPYERISPQKEGYENDAI